MKPVFDKCGKEILIGSYIVYGHNLGRCAGLKFGKVINIEDYKPNTSCDKSVRIKVIGVDDDWNFNIPKICKAGTLMYSNRIIVLPFEILPEYAKNLLKDL